MVKRESDGCTALRKRNVRDQRLSLRKPGRAQKEAATGKWRFCNGCISLLYAEGL